MALSLRETPAFYSAGTAPDYARGRGRRFVSLVPLGKQKIPRNAYVYEVPEFPVVGISRFGHLPRIETFLRESVHVSTIIEQIRPAVHHRSLAVSRFYYVRKLLSSAGKNRLDKRGLPVVIRKRDVLPTKSFLEPGLLRAYVFQSVESLPLKGRKGLGNKDRRAYVHTQVLLVRPLPEEKLPDSYRKVGYTSDVLLRFRGKPEHKVKLDGAVTLAERLSKTSEYVLLVDVLVYNVPQPLSSRFGREGQRNLPLAVRHNPFETVEPEARKSYIDLIEKRIAPKPSYKVHKSAVIAGRKTVQTQFVVARVSYYIAAGVIDVVHGPFPYRTVDESRLTETTAVCATPEKLHNRSVVNDFEIRNQGRMREKRVFEVVHLLHNDSFVLPVGIERRTETTRYLVYRLQNLGLALSFSFHLLQDLAYRDHSFFAFAHENHVRKSRYRRGIDYAGAASHYYRIALAPVLVAEWDSRKIEHIKHVGIAKFVLQGKTEKIEFLERPFRIERTQGFSFAP